MLRRAPPPEPLVTREEIHGVMTMVMRIDATTTRILEILTEEDGWEEED